MKTINRRLIKYYFPSLFFSAEASEIFSGNGLPKKLPKNCFGFRFGSETVKQDSGGKEYRAKDSATWEKEMYYIGEKIPLSKLPKDEKHSILCSNIESNSPTKEAIKCHLGNWQYVGDKNDKVVDVSLFEFENRIV